MEKEEGNMSEFWRTIILTALKIAVKGIELLTKTDIDGDGKEGF